MVTFRRKAAEGNPASTAALRRVAISLNQRRALRHPAGAPKKAMSFAVSLKKRIREEVMNGTFRGKAGTVVGKSLVSCIAGVVLAGMLAIAVMHGSLRWANCAAWHRRSRAILPMLKCFRSTRSPSPRSASSSSGLLPMAEPRITSLSNVSDGCCRLQAKLKPSFGCPPMPKSSRIAEFPLRSRGTVRGRRCLSRAGGRRARRTSLQACYDLHALPCPKYLVVSHRESHFSARSFFYFAFQAHSRAMNPPNIAFENSRAVFRRSCRAIK